MRYLVIFIQLILLQGALEAHGGHGKKVVKEEFHWTKEKSAFADIGVEIAGPGIIRNRVEVAGKITLHPDRLAYAIPQVQGTVKEIKKNLGDSVERDETVALIESHEIAEAKSRYLMAERKKELYVALLAKEEITRGISPEQDYLNAKWSAEKARINLQLAKQNLFALGLNEKEIQQINMESPQTMGLYPVKSPIKGKILQRSLCLGESCDRSAKLYAIGNFEKIWVEMFVPQSDVAYLKEGFDVGIKSKNGKEVVGRITQFNPSINEETRMATAIAMLENRDDIWIPGEFVFVDIQTDTSPAALIVPREAVQSIKGKGVIFVANGEEFAPRVVKLGKGDAQHVEILAGLEAGESYACRNAFCLKADYEKDEAEHSH